ncbi:MAG: lysozyme [Ahrensia sp.]|nr:lysozyme [Ahrensia sp.]
MVAGLLGRVFKQGIEPWREWLRLIAVTIAITLLAIIASTQAFAQATQSATLNVAVPFIAKWEGKSNLAYLDTIAKPPLYTICYGSTRGVTRGMYKTDAQCEALLRAEVAEYRHGLHGYFSLDTKRMRLTPHRDAAYTSLAFNAGIGGVGKSTATRRLNAGDIKGGCQALTWWNKAGGRVIRGLTRRRTGEYDLCMIGVGVRA